MMGAPPDYWCTQCGARECKLWRRHDRTGFGRWRLYCCECAEGRQNGERYDPEVSDQIGDMLPAFPVKMETTPYILTFWSHPVAPPDVVQWWVDLPLRGVRPLRHG